jgi:hypothetical protein
VHHAIALFRANPHNRKNARPRTAGKKGETNDSLESREMHNGMIILARGCFVLQVLAFPRSSYYYSPLGSILTMASSKRAAAVAPQRMMKQSALNFSGGPAPKKTKAADDNAFKIYCDLDGVLTDFDAGVEKICGKRPSQISSGMLWSSIARAPTFFDDLEWCSDGQELWNAIRPHQPDILTGCSRAAVAVHKAAWCKRELCVETNHVDMAAKKKAHEPVSGFRKQGVTNVITCWSKNKHRESGPQW